MENQEILAIWELNELINGCRATCGTTAYLAGVH